ncbi:hypothetical protein [Dysgonomonas termitidis]|uniref:Uncharacterized protein n=1 Tax=Dysgonomonas termitidis TaxID=1516126 RepID=A0ABV9KUL2_9BACT
MKIRKVLIKEEVIAYLHNLANNIESTIKEDDIIIYTEECDDFSHDIRVIDMIGTKMTIEFEHFEIKATEG